MQAQHIDKVLEDSFAVNTERHEILSFGGHKKEGICISSACSFQACAKDDAEEETRI